MPVAKILVANRGEIAVRIIRAARDENVQSVAVYAEADRNALHTRLADEAYSLQGSSAAETYLNQKKLLEVARSSAADSVHPGYGFLAENPEFAEAVIAAGLTWIGPPPQAVAQLGNKVDARRIAEKVGAPLAPGTKGIVSSATEVAEFADAFGFPIAIKAARGGGGRGIKIVREAKNIKEMYESAVREATAAFGSGECFVERFLDKPRHVETQCIADAYGNVAVLSTRDCSLQRRNQKLVEEAPAPFLTAEQNRRLYESSKAILLEAGYQGVGTCEFLVGADGTLSFLEVNTRLQVEHPVSEEVTGLDLVREQLRMARGEKLGYEDVQVRGHSFEFRINGEDPGRSFMPHPGTINVLDFPGGPGVRVDSGVKAGDAIDGNFDSMLAKLVVTGKTRKEALERSRRALSELTVEGIATVIPFHQAVATHPAFAPELSEDASETPPKFGVYTTWIEKEFHNVLEPYACLTTTLDGTADIVERRTITVEVGGKRIEVSLPADLAFSGNGKSSKRKGRPSRSMLPTQALDDNSVANPMQGTIVKVAVENGDTVAEGDLIVVLEAMKMEQPITAHKSGKIANLTAEVGQTVPGSSVIANII